MAHFFHIIRLSSVILIITASALLFSGCAGKRASGDDKYLRDPEELVQEPYTPRDDGLPLSASELKAFKSKGDLDKKLSQEDSRIVELHFKYFVHERRGTFERFLQRSGRFLPYVKKVFAERGVPEDMAYLFMVESGGNPNAISPAGAAGLWQFMPYTGKMYGLSQDSWIDERRDPFKATYAASDYLLKLMYDFNDWHLAAAAYNAGEGKIGRAVQGTGANDFFELCRLDCNLEEKARLKDETRQYVPRLLAIAKIMRNLEILGFKRPLASEAYNLSTVTVPQGTNLRGLAKSLGYTWEEFSAMNPSFRRTASPPNRASVAYIPPDQVATAQTWLASNEAKMYASWKEHTVKKRESLAGIAKKYKVSVASIKEANSFSSLPSVGSVILIPKGKVAEPVVDALSISDAGTSTKAGSHTVGRGDSLFNLAKRWGTDTATIRKHNKLSSDSLKIGQKLNIPPSAKNAPKAVKNAQQLAETKNKKMLAPVQEVPIKTASYTVQSGDTLFSIAQKYGISVNTLRVMNNMTEKTPLVHKKVIKVPASSGGAAAFTPKAKKAINIGEAQPSQQLPAKNAGVKNAPATVAKKADVAPKKPATVTVAAGDTLYSIAKKYNVKVSDLEKANKLTKGSNIKLGQTIKLP